MSERITAQRIKIRGRVQGIGFRPYVYRLAQRLGLNGWVLNNEEGVIIHLEGPDIAIQNFLATLPVDAPPLAHIEKLETFTINPEGVVDFTIRRSEINESLPTIQVQPDIATCEICLRELFSPADRRYLYPFINCTNCGPRFSIVKDVPYDRCRTTMSEFQ
ncbi:MAG: acylphosphatase, partial [Candidatus Sumerlaeia bacterium]|nr:acylphosphatase [Candidatus Sumerlaeia bacterium]